MTNEILKKEYDARDIELKEEEWFSKHLNLNMKKDSIDKIFKTIDIDVYFDRLDEYVLFNDDEKIIERKKLEEQFENKKEFIVEGWLKYYAEDEEIKQFVHLLE